MTQASYLVTLYLNSFYCKTENNSIYPHLFVTQIKLVNIHNTLKNNDIHNTLRTMHGT